MALGSSFHKDSAKEAEVVKVIEWFRFKGTFKNI